MNTNKCTQVDVFETIHTHNLHLHTDHVCIHRQVHTCTLAPTDTCTCKQVHMCILMHTHAHAHAHTHTHTHTHSHTQSSSLIIIFVFEYYKSIIHSSNSISYNLWYISCILPCCKTISLFLLLQGLDYFQLGASLWSLETRSQPGFDPRPDDFELWFDYKPEMLKELDKQEYYSSGLVDFLYQLLDGVESRRLGISAICWDHPFLLVSGH